MTSLSHIQNGATTGSAAVAPASSQGLTAIVVGVAVFAAGVLFATPISQAATPALLALVAAATVFASRAASDRGAIAAALVAVVAILGVQLAPTAEIAQLSRMVVGTLLGGLLVTAARLVRRRD